LCERVTIIPGYRTYGRVSNKGESHAEKFMRLVMAFLVSGAMVQAQQADLNAPALVLLNGKILTMDGQSRIAVSRLQTAPRSTAPLWEKRVRQKPPAYWIAHIFGWERAVLGRLIGWRMQFAGPNPVPWRADERASLLCLNICARTRIG